VSVRVCESVRECLCAREREGKRDAVLCTVELIPTIVMQFLILVCVRGVSICERACVCVYVRK